MLLKQFNPELFENKIFPLEREDLITVHSARYIDSIIDHKERHEYLPELLKGGAVTASILYAFEESTSSLVPTSGFHHACFDRGGTFCIFNSPMVGLKILIKNYGVKKIGYIDLDAHYSDGTHDIIERLGLIDNFIIYDFTEIGFAPGQDQKDYSDWLKGFYSNLEEIFSSCEFLYLYHGYDAHLSDPLGGYLDDHNIKKRDDIIFSFLADTKIPFAWCLGGAYFERKHVQELQLNGISKWIST